MLAVRDGWVDQVNAAGNVGTLNEYVTIGPVTYVHVRVGRDRHDVPLDNGITVLRDERGKPDRVRVARGWHVRTGEIIGTVNRFRHVHLSIGPAGEEANALDVGLPNFVDTIPPVIAPRGVEIDGLDDRPLAERLHARLVVRGPVRIVVEAWDRVDGDAPSRRLGVYRLGYQILTERGEPVPGFEQPLVTISFDRLPGDPDAPHALYAKGSGIPFYRTWPHALPLQRHHAARGRPCRGCPVESSGPDSRATTSCACWSRTKRATSRSPGGTFR